MVDMIGLGWSPCHVACVDWPLSLICPCPQTQQILEKTKEHFRQRQGKLEWPFLAYYLSSASPTNRRWCAIRDSKPRPVGLQTNRSRVQVSCGATPGNRVELSCGMPAPGLDRSRQWT
uniref:Uncharacterized protein n=1 Tax=Schistocephalus solidus TaxID=70667 RepID=A0A0V0JAN5_SCHSO